VTGFVAGRLAQAVVVLLLVSAAAFALVLGSGDPVAIMLPTHATEQDRVNLQHELGLDRPAPVQYATFLEHALTGDLGQSVRFDQPVLPLIASKLPATLELVASAMVLALAIAVPLGVLTGMRPGSLLDLSGTFGALLSVSIPGFWLGLILILAFGDYLRLLPVSGSGGVDHLVMPALTLAIPTTGLLTRVVRASVANERRQTYVLVARAKGLASRTVNFRHVLRNAMIPTVTVVGLQIGALLGGTVIVETVFAWPGAGWLLMQGVFARDLPLVRALVLLIGAATVLLNLLVDVSYRYIDPRVRY
jgi:peptide/nickel transport system permease protein